MLKFISKVTFSFLLLCQFSLTAQVNLSGALNNELKQSTTEEGEWDNYYRDTLNETIPRVTLSIAQQYFELEEKTAGLAVDLGTGTGRDALFLLKHGWNVLAIDAELLAIEILLARAHSEQLYNLDVAAASFSDMVLPDNIDLINASYSLPFCTKEEFSESWQKIVDHLAIGGRFAGNFFGDRDEWASDPSGTFHTNEEMHQLFAENFAIEYLKVEEGLLPTASGKTKYWHVYHVVARKIK